MSSIVPYLQNQPTVDFHRKKLLLNEEFRKKAKIEGLASYIYYPSQRGYPVVGHAELEVEGRSWTLIEGSFTEKALPKMIRSSQRGKGFPFWRFNISVTPSQLKTLGENSVRTRGKTCSMGVLKALSSYGKYSVPFPLTVSPMASAAYLYIAKKLGSKRISQIEFFHGQNRKINLAKYMTGMVVEGLLIAGSCAALYFQLKQLNF